MATEAATTAAAARKKTVILRSHDGAKFDLDETAARESQVVVYAMDDVVDADGSGGAPITIDVPNVDSAILDLVVKYCKKHGAAKEAAAAADNAGAAASSSAAGGGTAADELNKWDADFLNAVDRETVFSLILAANYLEIKGLLEITWQAAADMIAGCKDPEEIRKMFSIKNDLTEEEEGEIRRNNSWAFP